jgi:hypothetical protein
VAPVNGYVCGEDKKRPSNELQCLRFSFFGAMPNGFNSKPPQHDEAGERLNEAVESEANEGDGVRDSSEKQRNDTLNDVVADSEIFQANVRKDLLLSCLHYE